MRRERGRVGGGGQRAAGRGAGGVRGRRLCRRARRPPPPRRVPDRGARRDGARAAVERELRRGGHVQREPAWSGARNRGWRVAGRECDGDGATRSAARARVERTEGGHAVAAGAGGQADDDDDDHNNNNNASADDDDVGAVCDDGRGLGGAVLRLRAEQLQRAWHVRRDAQAEGVPEQHRLPRGVRRRGALVLLLDHAGARGGDDGHAGCQQHVGGRDHGRDQRAVHDKDKNIKQRGTDNIITNNNGRGGERDLDAKGHDEREGGAGDDEQGSRGLDSGGAEREHEQHGRGDQRALRGPDNNHRGDGCGGDDGSRKHHRARDEGDERYDDSAADGDDDAGAAAARDLVPDLGGGEALPRQAPLRRHHRLHPPGPAHPSFRRRRWRSTLCRAQQAAARGDDRRRGQVPRRRARVVGGSRGGGGGGGGELGAALLGPASLRALGGPRGRHGPRCRAQRSPRPDPDSEPEPCPSAGAHVGGAGALDGVGGVHRGDDGRGGVAAGAGGGRVCGAAPARAVQGRADAVRGAREPVQHDAHLGLRGPAHHHGHRRDDDDHGARRAAARVVRGEPAGGGRGARRAGAAARDRRRGGADRDRKHPARR
eukprot:1443118-Rhodomonas_salina.1